MRTLAVRLAIDFQGGPEQLIAEHGDSGIVIGGERPHPATRPPSSSEFAGLNHEALVVGHVYL
jgi:hypothetical protein